LDPGVRKNDKGEVDGWLYPGDPDDDDDYLDTPGDYDLQGRGHGTCMTGLISSPTYGVAKRATLVIVKTLQEKMSDQTDAFRMVHNDILDQREKGATMRPVINYSRNMVPDAEFPVSNDDLQKLYNVLEQLINDGAVILVCAGNKGVGGLRRSFFS
jgi:hypothetical protein